MKKLIVALVVGIIAGSSFATLYTDTVGDGAFGIAILDIVAVEVTDDGTDVNFRISLNADIDATDWGKYTIGIDTTAGGDTTGNGWGRPFGMSSGMDYWVGSWVDTDPANGAQLWSYNGATWDEDHASTWNPPTNGISIVDGGTNVTVTVPLANLGLNPGDSFTFDVFTTGNGGTDTAIDSLWDSSTTVAAWDETYSSDSDLGYTTVPEPSTVILGMLGVALVAIRRLIRRK